MKLVVNYVVQGKTSHRYNSELLELAPVPPLYSPRPHQHEIENEVMKRAEEKQKGLPSGEKIVLLKTFYS